MILRHMMTGLLTCLLFVSLAAAESRRGADIVAGMTAGDRLLRGQQKFDCGGRIIEAGVSRADVLAACGPPAWQDRRTDSWAEGVRPDGTVVVTVFDEEWIFDFGPDRLLHFVYFRDDRVAGIRTGGYGGRSEECRDGDNLSLGDSKLEVFRKCGIPTGVGREEEGKGSEDPGIAVRRMLDNDIWSYDFGPDRFVRKLTFRNGRLRIIERGGYGR